MAQDYQKLIENYVNRLKKSPVFLVAVALIFLLLSFWNSFFVEPNEFAVKQIKIGVNRGIQEKVYNTGFHFVLPAIQICIFILKISKYLI